MKLPRAILADDHGLVVDALQALLEPYCKVVGTASDGRALIEVAQALRPDIVVLDIMMPLLNGLEAGRELKAKMPGIKLIFLTMNQDPDVAGEAIRAGASGYVLKQLAASELVLAIQEALKGRRYVTPQIAREMEATFIWDPRPGRRRRGLTSRQREVVKLMARGKSLKEAAAILKLTPRTVAFHKYRIMKEQGFKTNAALIRFAFENHIV